MLDSLMTWDEVKSDGKFCVLLKGVTLKVPIEKIPVGATFVDALFDFENGFLVLGTYGGQDCSFDMELSIEGPELWRWKFREGSDTVTTEGEL
jgi:hypothetical protein